MTLLGFAVSRIRRRVAGGGSERGAMLVIALIIVTTVALVTGAILSHGWVNLRSTIALRGVAGTSYAADAAAKVAINDLRLGSGPKGARAPDWIEPPTGVNGNWNDGNWNAWVYTNNSDGTGCFGLDSAAKARNALELKDVYPNAGDQIVDTSARVECTPVPGTGIRSGGKGVSIGDPSATDPYAQALTTTGSSATSCNGTNGASCSGLYFKVLGTGDGSAKLAAPVGGGVNSNTSVTVDNGAMTTNGFVHANGSCSGGSGTIVSSDTQCHAGAATMPSPVSDILTSLPTPIYDAASTYPVKDGNGNCFFTGGSYASGAALSAAVNKCTVAYFASGKYYFDFQDPNAANRVWNIGNTEVIGGAPTAPPSAAVPTIPGACRSPLGVDNGGNGVQFVFGGNSTVVFGKNSSVELCGPTSSGAPLTIVQQQAPGPSATITDTPTATPITTTTSFGPGAPHTAYGGMAVSTGSCKNSPFTTTSGSAGPLPATWTAGGNNYGGSLHLAGFQDSTGANATIPAGAVVSAATARVDFGSTPPPTTAVPTVTLSGVTLGSANGSKDFTLNAAQLAALTAAAASAPLSPSIDLATPCTGSKSGDTYGISQVSISVTYTTTNTPVIPPTITTVALEPWSSSSAFISSAGGATSQPAKFFVQGATYAPLGNIDIEDSVNDSIAFRWGLVARGVSFKTYPAQAFGFPIVSIPAPGPGLGSLVTAVDLTVYVCVESLTCSSGGTKALTVRVVITDPPYGAKPLPTDQHPTVGVRQMKIVSWSEQR